MKHVRAGLVLSIAAAFAAPAFAQDATQLAGAVAPMALAQYGGGPDRIDCGSVDMRPARCPVPWRRAVLTERGSSSCARVRCASASSQRPSDCSASAMPVSNSASSGAASRPAVYAASARLGLLRTNA